MALHLSVIGLLSPFLNSAIDDIANDNNDDDGTQAACHNEGHQDVFGSVGGSFFRTVVSCCEGQTRKAYNYRPTARHTFVTYCLPNK